ncbi:protein FAM83H [Osmerus mordax]|uniref:protein FAM83H n=1 Tax=Osmerus mordax TaxID=8014 RepID=UPI00350EE179
MAHRSQCSSAGDNPLDPHYLPPHYREEYRLAIDALVEKDLESYYGFLQNANVVDFLSRQEVEYIKHTTQMPHQSTQPELCAPELYLGPGGEGSSDTYWPMHSDLDAPGLDLGWPQQHRFIGPTEVTTLVNPSEPDMPSIKEHARRLIKNAQQLVAVVMDMFTDVDIFADILDAAGRNVAVYILLDEHNVHHFTNMVSNCRVNLENIPLMRVRTVSGLTYYCRTGKSFKGQMMNRFLLTDCRAVLSGNYSFMWSFEKIHRCIAHLFLGQLVTTFDEEFRILFAQSQPLIFENVLAPMPDFSSLSDRLSSTDQTPLFRDPRKVLPIGSTGSMEWARHSFDERMYLDQKQMALRKHKSSVHRSLDQGQLEMYNSSQHLRMDPSLIEQGYPMVPSPNTMDSNEFKSHSFVEGAHGRVPSYRFMQHQTMQGFETQGRQMHREQQREHPLYQRAGPEPGYAGYDKFRGYGYPSMDQYTQAEYPPEMEPEPYDPVLNYLSSTSSVAMNDDSCKAASGEISLGLPHPKRISIGQPYACRRSPTQKMPSEQNEFFQQPNMDHETPDLNAKQGMRDWRISSYLSAFDDTGDEDVSMQPPIGIDPFEEPLKHIQVESSGPVLSDSMFRTKEIPKFQTAPRVSKLPYYTKSVLPEFKKVPDIVVTMSSEADTTPSESSSTTEGEKTEEVEVKEPKEICVKREESFRKSYNAAVQRSSRLRSSLIFSSQLEQHFSQDTQTTSGQHDEETSKNENDQFKLPFASPMLVKRRSFTREPFEWSRYVKSVGTDSTITESSKSDDLVHDTGVTKLPKVLPDDKEIKKQPKPTEVEQTVLPAVPPPKRSQDEQLKTMKIELKTEQLTHSTKPFSSSMTYVDMSDPDSRLVFFKELAAKRKAEKNAPLVNIPEKACIKTDHSVTTSDQRTETASQKVEPGLSEVPKTTVEAAINISAKPAKIDRTPETTPFSQEIKSKMSTVTCEQSNLNPNEAFKPKEQDPNIPPNVSQPLNREGVSSNEGVLPGSTDAEKIELKRNQIVREIKENDPTTSNSAFVGSNTIEKQCRPPDSSSTGSSINPISSVSSPSPNQSTQIEISSSHPPKQSNMLSSLHPTPVSNDSAKTLTSTKCSESLTKGTIIDYTPALNEPSSSVSPQTDHLFPPNSSPQCVPGTKPCPPTIPSESGTSTLSIPLESSQSASPDESVLPINPEETKANESQSSLPVKPPFKTKKGGSSSSTPPHTERISAPQPSLATLETSSTPHPAPSSTSSTIHPAPSETHSTTHLVTPGTSSTLHPAPTAASLTLHPVTPETSLTPHPVTPETSLTPHPVTPETSSTHHPVTPGQSSTAHHVTPGTSSTPHPVTPETSLTPQPVTPETSSTTPPVTPETSSTPATSAASSTPHPVGTGTSSTLHSVSSSTSSNPHPDSPKASSTLHPVASANSSTPHPVLFSTSSTTLCQENTPESQTQHSSLSETTQNESLSPIMTDVSCYTATESGSSPESHSDSVLAESSENYKTEVTTPEISPTPDKSSSLSDPTLTESSESPFPTHIESCSSSTQNKSSSSVNTVLTEFNPIPNSTSGESNTPNLSIVVENNSLNKEPLSELCVESKPETSEESVFHESQIDEANVTPSASESASDQVIPISPQSKNSKVSQSRYHSSTANVLSSSNLRDDTKILLEQISANSQSRAELAKETAVTDDAKEDEAHRVGSVEEGTIERSQSSRQCRTDQERQNLLKKIKSMRKEKKVYSRFEMAP